MAKKKFWAKAGAWLWKALKAAAAILWKATAWIAKNAMRAIAALFSATGKAAAKAVSRASVHARAAAGHKPVADQLRPIRVYDGSCEEFEDWLYSSKSTVGIILGSRGSGKSALGMRLLENWAASGRKVCAMGFDPSSVPSWISMVNSAEDAPNGSALLVDEGGILFGSRDSMSGANKLLSKLLFVARHRDLSIVFISQNSANLEINGIRQADYLLLKKPSLLQRDFERDKIKEIYDKVAPDFKELGAQAGLVYAYCDRLRGFASNSLPSFWSERASKAFGKSRLSK